MNSDLSDLIDSFYINLTEFMKNQLKAEESERPDLSHKSYEDEIQNLKKKVLESEQEKGKLFVYIYYIPHFKRFNFKNIRLESGITVEIREKDALILDNLYSDEKRLFTSIQKVGENLEITPIPAEYKLSERSPYYSDYNQEVNTITIRLNELSNYRFYRLEKKEETHGLLIFSNYIKSPEKSEMIRTDTAPTLISAIRKDDMFKLLYEEKKAELIKLKSEHAKEMDQLKDDSEKEILRVKKQAQDDLLQVQKKSHDDLLQVQNQAQDEINRINIKAREDLKTSKAIFENELAVKEKKIEDLLHLLHSDEKIVFKQSFQNLNQELDYALENMNLKQTILNKDAKIKTLEEEIQKLQNINKNKSILPAKSSSKGPFNLEKLSFKK